MTGLAVDLFGLDGVICAAAFIVGGIHLESLSHLSSFFAGLVFLTGNFGDLTHLDVSGRLGVPDGHCHELVDGVVVGVDVVAGNLQFGLLELLGVVVVELFLGFRMTLLGQLNLRPAGILARYFGGFDSGAGPVELVGGSGPFCGLGAVGVVVLSWSEERLYSLL